ncbi:MAG TPA: adenylate/guanylate cyclase domain-containing protein [Gaiellaceae bacterium]
MGTCRSCGTENTETARFCQACGGPLDHGDGALPPHEVRKTVTILFADVAGSTALGERLDPEALRGVMSRYYHEMRTVLESHGGTVEKFIGDAVMAVFGAPVAHEDDALRAVRAADDMRKRLRDLNGELEPRFGVALEIRIGVNTGEVVAGDPSAGQALVTGDAVNLAKRLEEAAPDGSILIGKATYPLVKDAVQAGPLESFSVKGKAQPVSPFRLDAIDPEAAGIARALERRFVGRMEELAALQIALRRAEVEETCRLFTVLGPAGIGKSRLVAEFAAGSGVTVLEGRCLPYGEGITLWPFREIVRALGGADGVRETLHGADDAELVVERVMSAVGAASGAGHAEETPWAFRRLLGAIAQDRPAVVVLEDVHWAAPPLLDLVEYLLGWLSAPVLLVCLAREDLVDLRPGWLNLRSNADTVVLEPLDRAETESLLGELRADPAAKHRIAAAAEGNPLFLEQIAAFLADEHDGAEEITIPPSIQALLAARLDQLDPVERAVIERAAVVGREFSHAAVSALSPLELASALTSALMTLVRKRLLLPDISPGQEDRFRFDHVLIRDAAYEAVPKKLRAELHERLADWLDATQTDAPDELIGYHLEQGYRLAVAVAGDGTGQELRDRAADRLAAAGRKAFLRGDMPAAANLLGRAADLLPNESSWLGLAPDLGVALRDTGAFERADTVLSRAIEAARAADDPAAEALADVERAALRLAIREDRRTAEVEEAARRAIVVFTELGDDHGLARAWHLVGRVAWMNGQAAAMEAANEQGLEHARRTENAGDVGSILRALAMAALFGPRPMDEALDRCAELEREARGDRRVGAVVDTVVAGLEARRGRFEEARALQSRSEAALRELGLDVGLAGVGMYAGTIELLAGDPAAAEREFRAAEAALRAIGDRATLSTAAALLAEALHVEGSDAEAERYALFSIEAASLDDLVSQVISGAVRAKVLARRSEPDFAERIARESVALAAQTDFSWLHGDALVALATALGAAGKQDEAREALEDALRLYEGKGDVVSSRKTRALLADLQPTELDPGITKR